jgi:hypothetical protein
MFGHAGSSEIENRSFEEAKLLRRSSSAWLTRSVIIASIALAFALADARPSFAGCGGYCEAQQARAMCHKAVNVQGLKAEAREAEFDKCKADPTDYLQFDRLPDTPEMTLD